MDRYYGHELLTQTQPDKGGAGGGGKTRNGLGDGNPWDDAAPGTLATRVLQPHQFLSFIRELESTALAKTSRPVAIYWSAASAGRMLPTGPQFRDLLRDMHCVSIFSEETSAHDTSLFCIFTEHGSVFLAMQLLDPVTNTYKCFGSIDSNRTIERMKGLFDRFRWLDVTETNRLVEKLQGIPFNSTNMSVFGPFYQKWTNGQNSYQTD